MAKGSIANSRILPVLLFVGAGAAASLQFPGGYLGPGYETTTVARHLAQYGSFADPFGFPSGPTAIVPPLYPAFLALIIRLLGDTPVFALLVSTANLAMHGLHAALLPGVSQVFFRNRWPGLIAGALTMPLKLFYLFPQFEMMWLAVGLMVFFIASDDLFRRGGRWPGIVVGCFLGMLALLNPASVCITVPWVIWRAPGRRVALYAAAAALLMLLPWTIRNYAQFHSLFFVRDNLGLELYVSNNDLAEATFFLNHASECHHTMHPASSPVEAAALRQLGEARYLHRCLAKTLEWIGGHRQRFLDLTVTRLREFWFPVGNGDPFHAWSIALVTAASAIGFAIMAMRHERVWPYFAAILLLYPLMYYLVQADMRYRAPFLWVSLLGTGYLFRDAGLWLSSHR